MRKKQRLQLIIQIFLRKEGITVLDKLKKETKPALAKLYILMAAGISYGC